MEVAAHIHAALHRLVQGREVQRQVDDAKAVIGCGTPILGDVDRKILQPLQVGDQPFGIHLFQREFHGDHPQFFVEETGAVQCGQTGIDHLAGVVVDRPAIERPLDIGIELGVNARIDHLAGAQGVEKELIGDQVGKPGHAPVQGIVEAAGKPVDKGVGAADRRG